MNDYRIFYDIIETEVIIIAIVPNGRHGRLAQPVRHPTTDMITASISEIKNDFSAYVSQAKNEDVIVTNHGKPVAFIRGFENEDDYLEHRLLNDPRFQEIVEKARSDYRAGRVTRLEDIDK